MDEEVQGCPVGIIFQSLLVGGPFESEIVTNDLPVPEFVVRNEYMVGSEPPNQPEMPGLRPALIARMGLQPPFDFQSHYFRRHVYQATDEGLIYCYVGWFQG